MHIKNWAMAIELTQDHWKKVVRYIRATPMIKLGKHLNGCFDLTALHQKAGLTDKIEAGCHLCEYAEVVKERLNRIDKSCILCPVYQSTGVNCYVSQSIFKALEKAKTKKALLAAAITIRDFELTTQGIE